ncbi:hypothetical protein MPER_09410, partial [Moniliophthora perniciosa FA553]
MSELQTGDWDFGQKFVRTVKRVPPALSGVLSSAIRSESLYVEDLRPPRTAACADFCGIRGQERDTIEYLCTRSYEERQAYSVEIDFHHTGFLVLVAESRDQRHRSGDKKKRFVEIWNKENVVVCRDVTDIHGAFYNDDYVSSLSFSPSENAILYIAEEKFSQSKDTPAHYLYKQSFGEGLPDKKRPAIFAFS